MDYVISVSIYALAIGIAITMCVIPKIYFDVLLVLLAMLIPLSIVFFCRNYHENSTNNNLNSGENYTRKRYYCGSITKFINAITTKRDEYNSTNKQHTLITSIMQKIKNRYVQS